MDATVFAQLLLALALLAAATFMYFLPTFIASRRHKRNTPAIFLVNLAFGWTFLGWMIALVWAVTVDA